MDYVQLGAGGLRVSRLCLGTMNFGGPTAAAESLAMMAAAMEAGVNFIDTADVYTGGESERLVGQAIAGRRDAVVLATKARNPVGPGPNDHGSSRKHLRLAIEASLRRLGTDYIDLYYLHRPDDACPIEESWQALDDFVRAGKVLYAGVSNFWGWQAAQVATLARERRWAPLSCLQPLYNLANRDAEVELLPLARAMGLGVVSYSPIARGVLTGKYQAGGAPPPDSRAARGDKRLAETEWRSTNLELAAAVAPLAAELGCTMAQFALAWVLANPLITAPIIGPRTPEQLADNLGALAVSIPPEMEARLDELVPPGTHTGGRFIDPLYPITGRRA
jgi:aryl-alcohol dehydrogenase-like predicted oxidoreductase